MAPTPSSSKLNHCHTTQFKTPLSKHRLQFPKAHPSPTPNSAVKDPPAEHLVEVLARIRDHPDRKEQPASVLQINPQRQSIRVRADFGYRDFTLDGVSLSEEDDLGTFYRKFVQSRIDSVKLGEDILEDGEDDGGTAVGSFVQVTVLEIYNEEIYDLLSSNGVEERFKKRNREERDLVLRIRKYAETKKVMKKDRRGIDHQDPWREPWWL